jgi:hypothetical protein
MVELAATYSEVTYNEKSSSYFTDRNINGFIYYKLTTLNSG